MIPRATARLEFRSWREDDLPLARGLWGDPRVMTYLARRPLTDEKVATRLKIEIDREREHGIQYWPFFVRATREHAGCCGLKPCEWQAGRGVPGHGATELGFHLCASAWGGGYATEAGRAAIDLAFGPLQRTELHAGHHPENEGSRRVLGKLGFQQIGEFFFEPTGLMHPGYRLARP